MKPRLSKSAIQLREQIDDAQQAAALNPPAFDTLTPIQPDEADLTEGTN